ncbi:MAG: hypothetical protein MJE77_14435 [Proteobacteria bacterium]|nr:hypothetical protein [Pseudomonadota bacterium]
MISQLLKVIEEGSDILVLGAGLLRLCRARLVQLYDAEVDRDIWFEREALRNRCEEFFREVDDEQMYPEERAELGEIALSWSQKLPEIAIVRTIAEALDAVLGSRFLPMFLGREVTLKPGDPFPTPHRDWRRVAAAQDDDSAAVEEHLDALTHLRLAGDWAREVRVTVVGNWLRWHAIPHLSSGDRLACATPNESLNELAMERAVTARLPDIAAGEPGNADPGDRPSAGSDPSASNSLPGRPVFFNARFGTDQEQQSRLCIALLNAAREHNCRVVAFPEFSITLSARQAVKDWLDGQDVVDMIIAGSCHRPGASGGQGDAEQAGAPTTRSAEPTWYSEAVVFLRGTQKPLVHRKFSPLVVPDPQSGTGPSGLRRHEHVATGGPAFTAHLSPYWTTIVLCSRDALLAPVPKVLLDLHANLVLVPALGFEMEAFEKLAGDIATSLQGIVLIANACVAPDAESARPPLIIGLPVQSDAVIAEVAPPRALVIATIGSLTKSPSIVDS